MTPMHIQSDQGGSPKNPMKKTISSAEAAGGRESVALSTPHHLRLLSHLPWLSSSNIIWFISSSSASADLYCPPLVKSQKGFFVLRFGRTSIIRHLNYHCSYFDMQTMKDGVMKDDETPSCVFFCVLTGTGCSSQQHQKTVEDNEVSF